MMGEGAIPGASPGGGGGMESSEDRTLVIASRLKLIYAKSILPIEKKFRYDYFFESPLLSDVEFDCKYRTKQRIWQETYDFFGVS
jgi:hypothetical protein